MRILSLVLAAALAGCATLQSTDDPGGPSLGAPGQSVSLDDEFNGGAIAVAPGGEVTVDLVSAAGTPYEWVLLDKPAFLRLASSEKIAAPQPANGEIIVGGPITNRFVFQGTGTGTGRLRFVLRSVLRGRNVARTWTGTITMR